MSKLRLTWVIDDDPVDNITFRKLSQFADFSEMVTDFLSAVDALDRYQQMIAEEQALPEAIFLDIRMPIVSGWDFIERYATIHSPRTQDTTIYMLTSSVDQSDIYRAKKHPLIADYLVKPITVEKLQEIKARHRPTGDENQQP